MNTKPILFSTEMVQAILEGRKTQTRRTKGLKVVNSNPDSHLFNSFSIDNENATFKRLEGMWQGVDVPYKTGDILWVRETFFCTKNHEHTPLFNNKGKYVYKATDDFIGCHKWKPSIHMPKEACRLFLKITNVRAERLKEISENDAIAEGLKTTVSPKTGTTVYKIYDIGFSAYNHSSIDSFFSLWKSINGKESLESNPWVWVIEFERIEKTENF